MTHVHRSRPAALGRERQPGTDLGTRQAPSREPPRDSLKGCASPGATRNPPVRPSVGERHAAADRATPAWGRTPGQRQRGAGPRSGHSLGDPGTSVRPLAANATPQPTGQRQPGVGPQGSASVGPDPRAAPAGGGTPKRSQPGRSRNLRQAPGRERHPAADRAAPTWGGPGTTRNTRQGPWLGTDARQPFGMLGGNSGGRGISGA